MPVFNRFRRSINGRSTAAGTANHLSDTDYAKGCKYILELRADIQKLGAGQDLKIDFPRLVVIGDQSSGKSSLVEAVSGINVPRDHGTCTRCPMECTMRSTIDRWSCSITLKFGFDSDGKPIANPAIEPFGQKIHDRSSVDLWIRRAQAAILSPHYHHREFLRKSEADLKEVDLQRLQFSRNSVCIEINDPESPDLDFVDLPGIVHAVDPPSLEEYIIDLVKSFIEPKNTVILIAMPMTSDWQTQTAVRLAKDADPKGDRTIAILTKPDALQDGDTGSRDTWRRILSNKDPDRKTRHGCYCVRLPNDLERKGGNRVKALDTEEEFFNSTPPWNKMEDRTRCGVPNFVKNISALLVELIEKYLPALETIVDQLLAMCLHDIAKLPPLLDKAPSAEILLRISAFCQAFKDAVFGRDNRQFVQENKKRYSLFKEEIYITEPRYTTFEPEAVVSGTARVPCLSLFEVRKVKESTITWELPPHVPFDATVILVKMYTSKWEQPSLECFDDIVKNSILFEETLLRTHFDQFGELLSYVRQLTQKERGQCRDEARRILKKILQFESHPLFTQNQAFLSSERTKWLIKHDYEFYVLSDHTKKLYHYYRHRHEENYQELELMADSYAYFQVAHKRIIDYVPLTIEHELNQTFVNNLQTLLFNSITRETPARLEELVREDSSMGKLRRDLETRRNELLKIKQKIDAFWFMSNVQPPNHSSGSIPRPRSSASSYHSIGGDSKST